MKKAEKIVSHSKPGAKRYYKWLVRRARRQAEKRDPENAPRQLRGYTRGWM